MRTDEVLEDLQENATILLSNNATKNDLRLFAFLLMNLDRLDKIERRDLALLGTDCLQAAFHRLLVRHVLEENNDGEIVHFCGLPLQDWRFM